MANYRQNRIKHIYNSPDIITHNLFYRDEYSIYRSNNHALTAVDCYLFRGEHDEVKSWTSHKQICDTWDNNSYYSNWRKGACVAVVNRKDKILVIKESDVSWHIRTAVPGDDWKIYTINTPITNPRIAEKRYRVQLLKLAGAALIEDFINRNLWRYRLVYTDAWYCGDYNLNADPKFIYRESLKETYGVLYNIAKFLKYNDLPNSVVNGKLLNSYYNRYYNHWSWSPAQLIKLNKNQIPTLNQIISSNIFNDKHQDILDKKMFYSKYCRGTIINYTQSEVEYYWNTKLRDYNDKVVDRCYEFDAGEVEHWLTEYREAGHGEPLWQDVVMHFYKEYEKVITELNKKNRKISDNNIKIAIEKYAKERGANNSVEAWRQGKLQWHDWYGHERTEARVWQSATLTQHGFWKYEQVDTGISNHGFPNKQLRLIDGNKVETSGHCTVSLDNAIDMYKRFDIIKKIQSNTDREINLNFDDKHINVGSYQLHSIKYITKVTDSDVSLGYKEWVVVIGCHRLWIDDFMDFVHYYHLEDKFGIKQNNETVTIKINKR